MRQAFPLVIKDYTFDRKSILFEGVNGQLTDIDFYEYTRRVLTKNKFVFGNNTDTGAQTYFHDNPFLRYANETTVDF